MLAGSADDGRAALVLNVEQALAADGVDAGELIREVGAPRRRRGRRQADARRGGRQEPGEAAGGARRRQGRDPRAPLVKVLALDYGAARTGVAVSDPSGTLARPVGVVRRARTDAGMRELLALDPRGGGRRRSSSGCR